MRAETIAIHSSYDSDPTTQAVAASIYRTAAYTLDGADRRVDWVRYASFAERPYHRQMPLPWQMKAGVTPEAIRFSIGIEHKDDIIADISQALAIAAKHQIKRRAE